MTREMTTSRTQRGMSLVEILVTIFVLTVGLLAIIRVLVPGLATLPRQQTISQATQQAAAIARQVETAASSRPDAVTYGVPLDPQLLELGWSLQHDVSMGDVDQTHLASITPGDLSATSEGLTIGPNVVLGEIVEMPMPLQVAMLRRGPYVPGSLKVYYPDPYEQVLSGADDGDLDTNLRRFEESGGLLTLDDHADMPAIPGFLACFTADSGGVYTDVVGVEVVQVGNTVDLGPALAAVGAGGIVQNSVTLYELVPGVADDVVDPALAQGGCIRFTLAAPEPGTEMACAYEMIVNERGGFDNSMVLHLDPEGELSSFYTADVQSFDTYVPLYEDAAGQRMIKLPATGILRYDMDGFPQPVDPLGAENVRVVNKLTGAIGVPGGDVIADGNTGDAVAGLDGYVYIDSTSASFPPGCPVRVYYRMPDNWTVEHHVAAANYSFFDVNRLVFATPSFVPESSTGLKQCWYTAAEDASGYWTLTFYDSGTGRFEEYLDPTSGVSGIRPDADGHRVTVDYRYLDAAGDVHRVTGESHLVDFTSHGFTLDYPDVEQIDAVRGASYKVRVCFQGSDRLRRRVDVDTIVLR